jgi:hypothetical protein
MVFGVLEEWMEGQLQSQAVALEEMGQHVEAIQWTSTLSLVLFNKGRHADALVMQEAVLERFRRVLPADHPDIGEGDV